MKKLFTKFQVAVTLILMGFSVSAQFSNVIIANGGKFEFSTPFADRATIGAYNPVNGQYWVFDTIMVESVQDVVVDGNFAYLAASDSIIKYDLSTYKKVGQVYFAGIRSITISNNLLFAGRFFGSGAFLEVFDKNTLGSLFTVPEINQTVYGVAVVGDSAYVSYNVKGTVDQFPPYGVYNDTLGKIAVIDLINQTFSRDIMLDTTGAGAQEIFAYNNQVYAICKNKGAVANYNPLTDVLTFDIVGVSGGFDQVDSLIYLNTGFGVVGAYDLKNMQLTSAPVISTGSVVASALDTLNSKFYFNTTDYASFGKSFIYDLTGNLVDSFDVNISPEAMDIDYKAGNYTPIALNDNKTLIDTGYISVLENDFDPNGETLILSILTNPINGMASVVNDSIMYISTLLNTDYIDSLQYEICDAQGCDSAWVYFNVDGATGIEDKYFSQIEVFPNPTKGLIKVNGISRAKYNVIDINGSIVEKGVLSRNSVIDITEKPTGVYFVRIIENQEIKIEKIVKF